MTIRGFKGFEEDLRCKNQQYEIGGTVSVDGDLEMCYNGLHFCLNPICTFAYYSPSYARYGVVRTNEPVLEEPEGQYYTTKCCARELTVEKEITAVDIAYEGVNWVREHAKDGPNVYTEKYCEDTISVTTEPDECGYWMQASTLLLATNKGSCVVNNAGSIALTLARFSVAMCTGTWRAAAIAHGSQSAAVSQCSGSVCVTMGCDSVAVAEGEDSVAFVGAASIAIVKGRNSVGMALFRGSKIRLEADGCMAMALGPVEVIGKGCVVMLANGYDKKATIKSVKGTRLLIPFLDTATYTEIICGESPAWPDGVECPYVNIMENFLKNV